VVGTYFVTECNRVDRAQVMIVFLDHLATSCVILHNLLVGHTSQELVRHAWIDTNHMRRLSSSELVETFSSLRIPHLHIAIVTGRNEFCSVRGKIDVVHRLGMPRKCPQKLSLVVYVP
jgi:hypothetical protein